MVSGLISTSTSSSTLWRTQELIMPVELGIRREGRMIISAFEVYRKEVLSQHLVSYYSSVLTVMI